MADRTESSIVISAAPAQVMAVIADLASYPEWSDGVKSVEVLTEWEDGRPGDAGRQSAQQVGPVLGGELQPLH